MRRECEWGTSKGQILGSRHDKAEVTMVSTAARRGNGTSVGVDLFGEEFDSRVIGGANDGGEAWMRERKGRRWSFHGWCSQRQEHDGGTAGVAAGTK